MTPIDYPCLFDTTDLLDFNRVSGLLAGVGVGAGGRAWAGDGAVVAAVADLGKITSHPNCLDLDNSQDG